MTFPIHRMIRSRRRSLALEVTEEGQLVVRAPQSLGQREIDRFVQKMSGWVEKKVRLARQRAHTAPPAIGPEEEARLRALARDAFIERACLYAERMQVTFTKIRLSSAKTRWGSCGANGTLCFHWRLINAPTFVLDYVVVHELAHLAVRDHSKRFWNKVGEFFPDYATAKKWLRENRV